MSDSHQSNLMTIAEVTVILAVSEAFVARRIDIGRLRATENGRLVAPEDVVAYDQERHRRVTAVHEIAEADARVGLDYR